MHNIGNSAKVVFEITKEIFHVNGQTDDLYVLIANRKTFDLSHLNIGASLDVSKYHTDAVYRKAKKEVNMKEAKRITDFSKDFYSAFVKKPAGWKDSDGNVGTDLDYLETLPVEKQDHARILLDIWKHFREMARCVRNKASCDMSTEYATHRNAFFELLVNDVNLECKLMDGRDRINYPLHYLDEHVEQKMRDYFSITGLGYNTLSEEGIEAMNKKMKDKMLHGSNGKVEREGGNIRNNRYYQVMRDMLLHVQFGQLYKNPVQRDLKCRKCVAHNLEACAENQQDVRHQSNNSHCMFYVHRETKASEPRGTIFKFTPAVT